jgi:hypothetical protein
MVLTPIARNSALGLAGCTKAAVIKTNMASTIMPSMVHSKSSVIFNAIFLSILFSYIKCKTFFCGIYSRIYK